MTHERCVLCGHRIEAPAAGCIRTTDGRIVHLACANRDARHAYQHRTVAALVGAGLAVLAVVLIGSLPHPLAPLWALNGALVALGLHLWGFRRWWRHTRTMLWAWWLFAKDDL